MITRQTKIWTLLAIALSLFVPALAAPQAGAERQPVETLAKQESSASKTKTKPTLGEATRVNTAGAARSAAQDVAKRHAAENASDKSTGPDVLEFRPTDQSVEVSCRTAVASSTEAGRGEAPPRPYKPVLKNVHGTAYGSLDPNKPENHRAGTSVGATSKSGKSSIYLETSRSRTTSPH